MLSGGRWGRCIVPGLCTSQGHIVQSSTRDSGPGPGGPEASENGPWSLEPRDRTEKATHRVTSKPIMSQGWAHLPETAHSTPQYPAVWPPTPTQTRPPGLLLRGGGWSGGGPGGIGAWVHPPSPGGAESLEAAKKPVGLKPKGPEKNLAPIAERERGMGRGGGGGHPRPSGGGLVEGALPPSPARGGSSTNLAMAPHRGHPRVSRVMHLPAPHVPFPVPPPGGRWGATEGGVVRHEAFSARGERATASDTRTSHTTRANGHTTDTWSLS